MQDNERQQQHFIQATASTTLATKRLKRVRAILGIYVSMAHMHQQIREAAGKRD